MTLLENDLRPGARRTKAVRSDAAAGRVGDSPPLRSPGKVGRMPRLRSLWLSLAEISHRLQESEALIIATDYDGTLIPIAEHPDRVVLSERTRGVLHRLAGRPDVHLAVLSGRRLDDLESQFNGGRLFLAGAGGLESRDERGRREVHLPTDARLPDVLRQSLEEWCQRFPGAWVEDKRF